MASSKPFYNADLDIDIDALTVGELLSLGDDKLSKLNKRELSRAVRTTALAANKRLNRLKAQAKIQVTDTGKRYVEKKSAKHAIALDALNSATKNGEIAGTFGVGDKNRNQLLSELYRIRHFMNLKTSTIKQATDIRKKREKALFGQTREEAMKEAKKQYKKDYKKETGKKPTKKKTEKVIKKTKEKFMNRAAKVNELYNKYQEVEHLQDEKTSSYFKGYGYEEVMEEIGEMVIESDNPEEMTIDDVLTQAQKAEEEAYIKEQDEYLKNIYSDWGLTIESSQDPFEF